MKVLHVVALGLAGWTLAASPAFADVKLTMESGRVTLVARDVTVRQILTEWARIGQTKIINLDRIPGGPVSLELTNVPEAEALDVLLRAVAGYLAAPRPVDAANLSHFDRIVVMPTSVAPRPAASAAPAPPTFAQPPFGRQAPGDDEDDDQPAFNMPPVGRTRGPIFNTPQQPQTVNPTFDPNDGAAGQPGAEPASSQPAAPGFFPRAPFAPFGAGVAVPGMIVQPPQPVPGTQPATTGRGGGPGGT
jgi:hypothetical protein